MPVEIIYVLFLLYIGIRVYNSIKYQFLRRRFRYLHYSLDQQEDTDEILFTGDGSISWEKMNQRWEDKPVNKELDQVTKKWNQIFYRDIRTKRFGSLVLGMVSLFSIWGSYQNGLPQSGLYMAMLPGIVGLFNTMFEWFEVKQPVAIQKVIP